MMAWSYLPSSHVPYQDVEALERCRKIKREELTKHPNPDFKIRIDDEFHITMVWLTDMFARIKQSDDEDKKVVLILPNPVPIYRQLAHMINVNRVNCRNVHVFAMDEYANEKGEIAPPEWEFGFIHALRSYLFSNIDEDLRMPLEQLVGPTDANIKSYSKMIEDAGEADACYSGPGWTGHLAFIEPDAPEFDGTLDESRTYGARVCTLSPYTLAQNSLHGSFGKSGDLAKVPPKAATIGPRDVIKSKYRMELHALTVHGTSTSWQRLVSRLATHGPVTPKLPSSIHQELATDCWISHENAANIEVDWAKGY